VLDNSGPMPQRPPIASLSAERQTIPIDQCFLALKPPPERPGREYGARTPLPPFFALIVFRCAQSFGKAGFAIAPMPPVKSEGRTPIITTGWPILSRGIP
jgi:hypothetical protein